MTKFSEELRTIGNDYLDQTLEQDFMQAVIKGKITDEQEVYYINQDGIYLAGYTENQESIPGFFADLTKATRRFSALDDTPKYKVLTNEADVEEDEVRDEFMQHYRNFSEKDNPKYVQVGKITKKYLKFLAENRDQTLLISLASVQPCAWGYAALAFKLKALKKDYVEPWDKWIDFYTNPDFANEGELLFEEIEKVAQQASEDERRKACEIFKQGMKLENEFWQQCFDVEGK
ncbi:hypothetical protein [Fructilactobacillus frigidiflavus]|uniref:hypothetical protein n=1 Tax=Fructilactobacillus frigidiflavus TaxID=3242688 RepID=UPI003757FD06